MVSENQTPSGRYVEVEGVYGKYKYFVPNALPPKYQPSLALLNTALQAQHSLSRLGAKVGDLPNPSMFINFYMRKEAEFSCQIEGTQASIKDVLEEEAGIKEPNRPKDGDDIKNYLKALSSGMAYLKDGKINLWFIRRLHQDLLAHQSDKSPGEFRNVQNQVGGAPYHPETADYVPPAPFEMENALRDFEHALNGLEDFPPLLRVALYHVQFETIHPFLDGNGRVGRLLITMQLFKEKIIDIPVLYLSYFFKKNKEEYNRLLQFLHDTDDWECWFMFFLQGVIETSENALQMTEKIDSLMKEKIERLKSRYDDGRLESPMRLLMYLFSDPIVQASNIIKNMSMSKQSVYNYISDFEEMGILYEYTGQVRNKKYAFRDYIGLLSQA